MHAKSRIAGALVALGLVAGAVAATAVPASAALGGRNAPSHTLFVFNGNIASASSHDHGNGTGCGNAPYASIGEAVTAADPGDTVFVCPGTYHEDVVITKAITVVGQNATIDATGQDNAVQVLASDVRVQGFTATHAIGEGILVGGLPGTSVNVADVTISDNTVVGNDLGNPTGLPLTTSPYAQCNAGAGNTPGDCGEGIHLLSASHSSVVGNQVNGNSGGILLTDENGPTTGNLIVGNHVSGNLYDCGITIASHLPQVFGGGVSGNTISFNQVTDNGVLGQGAGVLLASGVPGNVPGIPGTGGAVFNNIVEANDLAGNGLAGVTVHSHSPGQDLNGNVIEYNTIGTNNLDGDPDFFPAVDPSTTGVIVASVAPLSITIAHNTISKNVFGIWLMPAVSAAGTASNLFIKVTTPVGP
jgi:parallel beta-helix repeat protein